MAILGGFFWPMPGRGRGGRIARLRGVTPAGQDATVAAMRWIAVRRRIRQVWPTIERHVPEREKRSTVHIEYEDMLVFEAMLKMVWDDHPMRKPLGPPYPTVHPLYRRIAVLVQSRALDKLWAVYLRQLDKDERQAWKDAFERIQKGTRGGVSLGLAWFEIMRRGAVRRPRRIAAVRE